MAQKTEASYTPKIPYSRLILGIKGQKECWVQESPLVGTVRECNKVKDTDESLHLQNL